MKMIIAFLVLLLLIGGGGGAYFMMMEPEKPATQLSEEKEEEKPADKPEAPKPEKKKKDDPYAKFDYKEPMGRMRARSLVLKDLEKDRKETVEFLHEIDTREKKKRDHEKEMQKWIDKK